MVRLHRLDDALVDTEFLEDPAPYLDMRTLDLMINRFADVMQEGPRASDGSVNAELRGKHAGDMGHFDRVLEHILPIARPEMEAPQERDKFRIEPYDAAFKRCGFAFLLHDIRNLDARFLHRLLYLGRLDTAVGYEFFERDLCDRPAQRVERRKRYPIRSVIDENVDAGRALESFDIAALFPDYFSLYFLGRERD
jgi:hypothetical protein